jgi:hypothetical protein
VHDSFIKKFLEFALAMDQIKPMQHPCAKANQDTSTGVTRPFPGLKKTLEKYCYSHYYYKILQVCMFIKREYFVVIVVAVVAVVAVVLVLVLVFIVVVIYYHYLLLLLLVLLLLPLLLL